MMKAFSPAYYVKENKSRSILLILIFILSYGAWLGGLYATNIISMFEYNMETFRKVAIFHPSESDDHFEALNDAYEAVKKKDNVIIMQQGITSNLSSTSIMGFDNNYPGLGFRTVDDFKTFCRITGVTCDFDNLKAGSVIMSPLMANNRGMQLGDTLKEKENDSIYGKYTLDAITNDKGYSTYYIDTGVNGENHSYILMADGMSEQEFADYTEELANEYNISMLNKQGFEEDIHQQLNSINYIYVFIVILLAIVMAVTINAAFVGMYQHRQPEFAIYRAIGISKKRIIGKVAGELLLLDVIGLVLGGIIMFTGIYLFNNLYLIPRGLKFFYYHPVALFGMLLCNLLVVIPLILTRSRKLIKADVCEY